MKFHSTKKSVSRASAVCGMTLIEMIIYITLLSMLSAGFIRFAYATSDSDFQAVNEIHDAYVEN